MPMSVTNSDAKHTKCFKSLCLNSLEYVSNVCNSVFI